MDIAAVTPERATIGACAENKYHHLGAGAVALHIIAHRKHPMHLGPRSLRHAGAWYWVAAVALAVAAAAPWL
jgi:hypothetical protein